MSGGDGDLICVVRYYVQYNHYFLLMCLVILSYWSSSIIPPYSHQCSLLQHDDVCDQTKNNVRTMQWFIYFHSEVKSILYCTVVCSGSHNWFIHSVTTRVLLSTYTSTLVCQSPSTEEVIEKMNEITYLVGWLFGGNQQDSFIIPSWWDKDTSSSKNVAYFPTTTS